MNDVDIKAGSQPGSGRPRLLDSLRESSLSDIKKLATRRLRYLTRELRYHSMISEPVAAHTPSCFTM